MYEQHQPQLAWIWQAAVRWLMPPWCPSAWSPTPTHPPHLLTQVIKSRIQTQSAFAADRYRGVLDCGARLYRSGGWGSLWRGFGPCFLRSVPANSVAFLVFERVKTALS